MFVHREKKHGEFLEPFFAQLFSGTSNKATNACMVCMGCKTLLVYGDVHFLVEIKHLHGVLGQKVEKYFVDRKRLI